MFTSLIPLGRVGGVPVRAHWSVVIVLGVLTWLLATNVLPGAAPGHQGTAYWLTAAVTALGFLLSLLAHELAHAVVARQRGIVVKDITLWVLGGATAMETPPADARTELRVAISGPLTSVVIGGACYGAALLADGALPPLVSAGLAWAGLTNLVLGGFNLLPGAPLDGGRVLRALVWRRTGDRAKATAIAAKAGQALGACLIALGFAEVLLTGKLSGLWLGFLGWFLIGAAQVEAASDVARARLDGVRLRDIMDPHPITAPGWWTAVTFLERTAAHARQRSFPVVSFAGTPVGTVSLRGLARLTPEQRMNRPVSESCGAPPRQATADQLVTDLLAAGALRVPGDLVVVVENDAVIGTVSADDLARAMELAELGARPIPV